jgi:hypothetical protein
MILRYEPYEILCKCGATWGTTEPPFEEEVTVLYSITSMRCPHCNTYTELGEGFYLTSHINQYGNNTCVPYELLKPV